MTMTARQQKYLELREQGLTYQEIGDICGVTRQRVYQALRNPSPDPKVRDLRQRVVYPGLAKKMWDLDIDCQTLADRCYMSYTNMYHILTGRVGINKNYIDMILDVVGGTYEEVFREGEH